MSANGPALTRRRRRTEGPGEHEDAADLYRACRQGRRDRRVKGFLKKVNYGLTNLWSPLGHAGDTVRAPTDCLLACVALRARAALLHADRDFDAIARRAPLEYA